TITKPPTNNTVVWPGCCTVYKVPPGTYTLEVKHKTTGAIYRINFTVQEFPIGKSDKDIRLTVNSLTRIN
ncbi:MAG: hypothetical protein N3D15_03645, partial [Syntrophorhabdaceae bacterium]|nr:hypothetical protein [Syntrophorhabdaceae bacterium]